MSKNIKIGNKIYENVEYISCECAEEEGVQRIYIDEDSIDVSKPFLDTRLITDCTYFCYRGCRKNLLPYIDTSNSTSFTGMFTGDQYLYTITLIDTSKGTAFESMFSGCDRLTTIPQLDTSNGKNFSYMFNGCYSLTTIPQLDTRKGTAFNFMFYSCSKLTTIPKIDVRNATYINSMFNCSKLENLTLLNIKTNLQVGSGTSYGHLLTVESLIGLCKELINMNSARQLTVGSANLEKLANVYVKLIDITDEMRAADEFIDQKLPCEVCESTDEGAMLISDYVQLKTWTLA